MALSRAVRGRLQPAHLLQQPAHVKQLVELTQSNPRIYDIPSLLCVGGAGRGSRYFRCDVIIIGRTVITVILDSK